MNCPKFWKRKLYGQHFSGTQCENRLCRTTFRRNPEQTSVTSRNLGYEHCYQQYVHTGTKSRHSVTVSSEKANYSHLHDYAAVTNRSDLRYNVERGTAEQLKLFSENGALVMYGMN